MLMNLVLLTVLSSDPWPVGDLVTLGWPCDLEEFWYRWLTQIRLVKLKSRWICGIWLNGELHVLWTNMWVLLLVDELTVFTLLWWMTVETLNNFPLMFGLHIAFLSTILVYLVSPCTALICFCHFTVWLFKCLGHPSSPTQALSLLGYPFSLGDFKCTHENCLQAPKLATQEF